MTKYKTFFIALTVIIAYGCLHMEAAEAKYSVIKKNKGEKNVFPHTGAFKGVCSRSLTIPLPKSDKTYYVWLKCLGWGMELHKFKNGKMTRSWSKLNSSGKWSWRKIGEFDSKKYDKLLFIVPKPFDTGKKLTGALDCVVLTHNPNLNIKALAGSFKKSPSLLETKIQKIRTGARSQLLPLPADDTFLIDIAPYANIFLNPTQARLRVFAPGFKAGRTLNMQGFKLRLADNRKLFVGVWKPVAAEQLKRRRVKVAQGDDKVRVSIKLPAKVTIPVNANFAALSFLHNVKGAGEFGDVLFKYIVTYSDGTATDIPVKEGGRIGGKLKPTDISQGKKVFDNLVNSHTVSIFISSWKNPFPGKKIKSVTIHAVAKRIIPVLLGIAGHKKWTGNTSRKTAKKVTVSVDFGQKIKAVKDGLFAINVPYLLKRTSDKYFAQFKEVDFSIVRIWNRVNPKSPNSKQSPEALAKQDNYVTKLVGNSKTRILLNLFARIPKWVWTSKNPESHLDYFCDWYMNLLDYCINRKQWPVTHIEIFNEVLIGRAKTNPVRYKYYNTLAGKIKKKFPEIKVGGTAECWPDGRVLEHFIVNCGKNVDFLSWHMYATGKSSTPTPELLERTDRFASASRDLEKMLKKHYPNKKIEQMITEYNINYAAWKPPVEQRQIEGTGMVWLLSVLNNLLYDGEANGAMFWHFWSGSTYGIVTSDYKKRPAWTLFYLLNQHLRGAALCKVISDNYMVEALAAEGKNNYIIALINKSQLKLPIKLDIRNLKLRHNSGQVTEYRIGGKDKSFTVSKSQYRSGKSNYTLEKFSLIFKIIPKKQPR